MSTHWKNVFICMLMSSRHLPKATMAKILALKPLLHYFMFESKLMWHTELRMLHFSSTTLNHLVYVVCTSLIDCKNALLCYENESCISQALPIGKCSWDLTYALVSKFCTTEIVQVMGNFLLCGVIPQHCGLPQELCQAFEFSVVCKV